MINDTEATDVPNKDIDAVAVKTGIVLWTDGSCLNQHGPIGYGSHGYMYRQSVEKEKPVIVNEHYITDQGYSKLDLKPIHGHTPVCVTPVEFYEFAGSDISSGTNNKAELIALARSLEFLLDKGVSSILIYTDSEYLRKGILEWSKNWENNGWYKADGSEVPNSHIWKRLLKLIRDGEANDINFEVRWVKGHNDNKGNNEADELACIGSNRAYDNCPQDQFVETPAKEYLRHEVNRHPFVNHKNLYFNSRAELNVPGQYYQSEPGVGDFMIGKRSPSAGFSIIRLPEPDHTLESIRNRQCKVEVGYANIYMAHVDNLFEKEIHRLIGNFGEHYFKPTVRSKLELETVCKTRATTVMNPTGLSLRAIAAFDYLEDILDSFTKFREIGFDGPENAFQLKAHDVTSNFYNVLEKQVKKETVQYYELKPEHKMGMNNTYVTIQDNVEGKVIDVQIPLVYGCDILPRNNLKRLENYKPSIYVVTWKETPLVLRYATIIESNIGIGIWSNFFADKIFLKNPT